MGLFSKSDGEKIIKNLVGGFILKSYYMNLIEINGLQVKIEGKNKDCIAFEIQRILNQKVKNGELDDDEIELHFYFLIKQAMYINNYLEFNMSLECKKCGTKIEGNQGALLLCPKCNSSHFDEYMIDYDKLNEIKISLPNDNESPYKDMDNELERYIQKYKPYSLKSRIDQKIIESSEKLGVSKDDCYLINYSSVFCKGYREHISIMDKLLVLTISEDKISYMDIGLLHLDNTISLYGEQSFKDLTGKITHLYFKECVDGILFTDGVGLYLDEENYLTYVCLDKLDAFLNEFAEKYNGFKEKEYSRVNMPSIEKNNENLDNNLVKTIDDYEKNELIFPCPNCYKLCSLADSFCMNCGFSLQENPYDSVKESVDNIMGYAKEMDSFSSDQSKPIITDFNSNNISISSIVLRDLVDWMSYLGGGDGYIDDKEVMLINHILNSNYAKSDIIDLMNNNLNDNYANILPFSFVIFHENDMAGIVNLDSAGMLFSIYEDIGYLLTSIDGEITQSEADIFNTYMANLNYNIEYLRSEGYYNIRSSILTGTFWNGQIGINIKNKLNFSSSMNNDLKQNDFSEDKTLDDYVEELNKLIGLESVKNDVNSLINLIQVRQVREERGMEQPPMSLHLVFSGNPGTGKTTVARLLAKIYHKMGLLSKGHLVETDRSGLVGGYVGQTAIKTQDVIQNAMGGILFIDEAYTLSSSKSETDYGQESIDTILKAMEDNRDDLIVIVAGYPNLMQEFLQSNPGLESRFNKFIFFDDYNSDELYEIFKSMCDDNNLILEDNADEFVKSYFVELYDNRGDNFANGRDVRNLFENVLTNQANRIASNLDISDEELNTLKYEDFNNMV